MYIAFVMKPWGDIDEMRSFREEEEVDAFGKERTAYSELDPMMDDPDHWEKYDPPVVIFLKRMTPTHMTVASTSDRLRSNNVVRSTHVANLSDFDRNIRATLTQSTSIIEAT